MSESKKIVQLIGTILNCIFATILLIGIITLAVTDRIAEIIKKTAEEKGVTITEDEETLVYVAYALVALSCVAIIILSIKIFLNYGKKNFYLCVGLEIFNFVIMILYLIAGSLWGFVPLVIFLVLIFGMSYEKPKDKEESEKERENLKLNEPPKDLSLKWDKIEKIKQLNKEGILSDEEMKSLIIEEIKKD